jgi:undecaprenyl-diphosphatase
MSLIDPGAPPITSELRLTLAMNRLGVHKPVLLLFRVASRLGDGVFWYALMASLAAFAGNDGRLAALQMAATGLFVAGLYRLLKGAIRRPRPFRQHAAVIARVCPLDEFSFPSGHTLHAVTFTLIAISHFPQLAWLLVPFTLLVAGSRVVLGVHYPSDVLAAIGMGLIIGIASMMLL